MRNRAVSAFDPRLRLSQTSRTSDRAKLTREGRRQREDGRAVSATGSVVLEGLVRESGQQQRVQGVVLGGAGVQDENPGHSGNGCDHDANQAEREDRPRRRRGRDARGGSRQRWGDGVERSSVEESEDGDVGVDRADGDGVLLLDEGL